jgi:hypothetical protein
MSRFIQNYFDEEIMAFNVSCHFSPHRTTLIYRPSNLFAALSYLEGIQLSMGKTMAVIKLQCEEYGVGPFKRCYRRESREADLFVPLALRRRPGFYRSL